MINKLLITIIILSISGFLLASYLTYEHYMLMKDIEYQGGCPWVQKYDKSNPCAQVNASEYSKVFGIPIASLGAVMFLSIFILGILALRDFPIMLVRRILLLRKFHYSFIIFFITFIGTVVFIYLIYLQMFILHSFCPLCLVSAFITFTIFIISFVVMLSHSK